MRKIHAVELVLFAWMMIGADDCVLTQIGKPVTPAPPAPPPKMPFCYTDPPLGCAAFCADVDDLEFTAACSNVEAGPLEQAFDKLITDKVNALLMLDQHVCNPSTINVTITPCQAGITPTEWPNQDHATCLTAPSGCPL